MREKAISLLKKRIDFPTLKEIVFIVRSSSKEERLVFLVLFVIFTLSIFLAAWELNKKISVEIPAKGGTLTEGILGTPRFINPLLAISDADRDMTALIYSGLMRPDNKGGLELDLAEKYEISEDGTEYIFTLKPNLYWHDGEPITSDDVIFTIEQVKDPVLKSPKRAGWEGIEIEKIDERTIKFRLKKPYAPFLENTTLGILPEHIWKEAIAERMILSDYNIHPIGSGPYKIEKIEKDSSGIINSYTLRANEKFALGTPFIEKIIIKFYPTEESLLKAYQEGKIDTIAAISPQMVKKIEKENSELKTFSLPRVFAVFFNQNQAKIFTHLEVRRALDLATDKQKIIDEVLKGFGVKLDYPLPPGVFGAINEKNPEKEYNLEKAKELLSKNGWKLNEEEQVLEKKTKKGTLRLIFSLSTSDTPELKSTAYLLKEMWEKLGAKIEVRIFEIGDLNQNVIRPRKYDALLFGQIVGRDPDPFAFWHSSQRNDPGLNVAMYTNITVDELLEEARSTLDEKKRKEKYLKFQEELAKDVPAVFLYSPRFIYLIPSFLKGLDNLESITVSSERFAQIHRWYIKTDKIWKIFAKKEQ